MGFIMRESQADPIVSLSDDGDGGVYVRVGDTCIINISADGRVDLCDDVDKDEIGDLEVTEGEEDGWGCYAGRRVRVFFDGEELVLPSESAPIVATPKAKKSKKSDKVIE